MTKLSRSSSNLRTAESFAGGIGSCLASIVHYCRTGDYGDAAARLNDALAQIQRFIGQCGLTPSEVSKLSYSLQTMFAMQQHNDWVALADIIEYELTPLLAQHRSQKANSSISADR